MNTKTKILVIAAFIILLPIASFAQVRIKDLADIQGINDTQLVGYGLVVGLDGTGDSPRALFTNQSLANMLERFGISIASDRVRVRNVAAVMVTSELNPFAKLGQTADVTISSLGDSRSLQGGVLLLTPLVGIDENVYGMAQGPITLGGFEIESETVSVSSNASSVGRIPGGLTIEREPGGTIDGLEILSYALQNPDFTTARRIADAVNTNQGNNSARAIDAVTIEVTVPPAYPGGVLGLIADTESILVTPDIDARVVVNERTGTVIIGEMVRLSSVAISHGSLSISISNTPTISQPNAFSQGQTTTQNSSNVEVREQSTGVVVIQQSANVGDVAAALNSLGVSPRDIIAIFQALKRSGALHADLVVI
jgi:flagellar P-ring protein FlgI